LWLTGVLAVIGVVFSVASLLTLPSVEAQTARYGPWIEVIASHASHIRDIRHPLQLMIALSSLAVVPPIVGFAAALQTSRDVQSEAHDLLRLTSLTKMQIVQGYLYAGLHRMRLLLSLTIGIAPALIDRFLCGFLKLTIWSSIAPGPYHLTSLDIIGRLVIVTVVGIGLLALNPLVAALGVALSLWWRKMVPAILSTSTIMLLGTLSVILMLLTIIGLLIPVQPFSLSPALALQEVLIASGFCLAPPVLLTLGIMWLAKRWA